MLTRRAPNFPWECPRELQWSLGRIGENQTITGVMEGGEALINNQNRIRSQQIQPRFLRQTRLLQLLPTQGVEQHLAAVEGVEEEVALEEVEAEVGEEGVEDGDHHHHLIHLHKQTINQHQQVGQTMIGKLFLVAFVIIPVIVPTYVCEK